jgi:DNA-binding transcriptional MerR regulator
MADVTRHAVGELAGLAGVSRRTVRYYVQEGLLPAPLGVGRGRHYGPEHLTRLLQVKALQEQGRSLDEIRRLLADPAPAVSPPPAPAAVGTGVAGRSGGGHRGDVVEDVGAMSRAMWRRIVLAPGVELHVAAGVRLPHSGRLRELVLWCRRHFGGPAVADEENDA